MAQPIDLGKVIGVSAVAALGAQMLVHKELLAVGGRALGVEVKKTLAHKEGSAASDLVTAADRIVQRMVFWALGAKLPTHHMDVVGEEQEDAVDCSHSDAESFEQYWAAAFRRIEGGAGTSEVCRVLLPMLRSGNGGTGGEELRVADSRDVRIFVDPIDGTNCFVEGIYHAPMTLIGIALRGVPVGAVVNRIFVADGLTSLSFCLATPEPLLVLDGALKKSWHGMRGTAATTTATVTAPAEPLRVTTSSTTRHQVLGDLLSGLDSLGFERDVDRGAGNKLMKLVGSSVALAAEGAAMSTKADVFVAIPSAIHLWDTCAPHAFIRISGGEMLDWNWVPIRYASPSTELSRGVLALAQRALSRGEEIRSVLAGVEQRREARAPAVVAT